MLVRRSTRIIVFSLVLTFLALMAVLWHSDVGAISPNQQSQNRGSDPFPPTPAEVALNPDYDSGWLILGIRPDPIPVPVSHNLGGDPDDYRVSLECKDSTTLGTYQCSNQFFNPNAHWYGLTDTSIQVWAAGGTSPEEVRVRIFSDVPAYDSGWQTIGIRPDPIPIPLNHNLGGDPDDYLVSLECKDDTSLATYDCTDHGFNVNALWYDLDATSIEVWVPGGTRPDEVRVRIYTVTPDYDSGWHTLLARPDPVPVPFTHGLGGEPEDYQVTMECRDDTTLGTYDCSDFGFNVNALWYALTDTSITAWVTSGTRPDEVRVRILAPKLIYLPLILNSGSPP